MFFKSAKQAREYAKLEIVKTRLRHIVVPCKKYLCPPKLYQGQDHIPGFTVVLKTPLEKVDM